MLSKPFGSSEFIRSKFNPKTQWSPGFSNAKICPFSDIIEAKKKSDSWLWIMFFDCKKFDFTQPEPPMIWESLEPGLKNNWLNGTSSLFENNFLPPKRSFRPSKPLSIPIIGIWSLNN